MKTKLHILFIIALSLVWLILSADGNAALAATDWFVRPTGGNYGSEDGSSYQNAWDGLKSVVWGTGGVEAGDTLYICGLHLRRRTGGSAWEIITPGASGTGEDSRIIIRGDYPGDPGIVWGAGIMAHEPWVDEGDNTWSITDVGTPNEMWYFEDITADSWTVLKQAQSLEECRATPGSFYSPDYTAGSRFYVHTTDNGNPTNRIAANRLGYNLYVNDIHYITWLNLKFYAIYRWINYTSAPYGFVTHMRWENCTIWYGEFIHFLFRNGNHHNEFINCDVGWAKNGIGFAEYPIGSGSTGDGSEPHDCIIRGCKLHHIGIPYGTSDSHAVSGQGSRNILIENNEMYLVGTGVTFYCYNTNQAIRNITIRYNWIHDTHSDWGANSRGIELNTGPGQAPGTSAVVYGNIVGPNVSNVGYRYLWTELGEFYNNVAYDCGTSFYLSGYSYPVRVKLRNNISLNPRNTHIEYRSTGSENDYSIDSDYNLLYPISGQQFFFYEYALGGGPDWGYKNFTEWQAISKTGSVFDPHSIVADPLFVDPDNGNFRLRAGSPAIDAGVDVGLTQDFQGIPVPQGNAPDIGAYEYVLFPVSAILNEPKEGRAPLTVSFDGSQSTSPNGDIVSYEWDFGDGTTSQEKETSHTYTSPGEYTVTLTVTDNLRLKCKSQTRITVFGKEFGELPAGCYNNVFNPAKGEKALIVVELPKQGHVKLRLYNTRGNKIRELADEEKEAGSHKYYWDGKSDNGDVVGSGLYFVHIQAGDYKKTKKIVVVK